MARLLALHPKRIDLSLDRIERLLAALDHPERQLPPVIHVAGTNGKGSTVAFMRAILEAADKRVHVYTSPNLVRINERFRIGRTGGGRSSATTNSIDALEECERPKTATRPSPCSRSRPRRRSCCSRAIPPTSLLLEVGLGGRLDATNVVERPLATVITRVSHRSPRFSRRHHRADRRREGRHSQAAACRPCSTGQSREALAVIERQAGAAAAPRSHRRRGLDRDRGARPAGLSGRRRPARSAGAAALRPSSVRECRRRDRGAARERAQTAGAGVRGRHDPRRLAGAHAAAVARPAAGAAAARQRIVARRRAQRRRRPRHRRRARRSRGARVAPAGAHCRHAVDQGQRRFLANFSGLARRVIAVPIHQDKAVPADGAGRSRARRRHSGDRCATISRARSRSPASSISNRRRASSSPARSIWPARSWPPTVRRPNRANNHSSLMLPSRMTFAHFARSALI